MYDTVDHKRRDVSVSFDFDAFPAERSVYNNLKLLLRKCNLEEDFLRVR